MTGAFRRAAGRARGRWSLRTRLVVSALALIAVVCAVIGTVTTIVLHSSLQARLDDELAASVQRSHGPTDGPHALHPRPGDLRFVAMPGQPIGTVGARADDDGRLTAAARSTDARVEPGSDPSERLTALTSAQSAALARVRLDGEPHTVTLPGLGDYRVQSDGPPPPGAAHAGGALLVGLPMSGVESTLGTLIVVECCVTGAGLIAAGIAGTALVRIALRPLRRVAATATRVSELRLHRGEVTLPHRVPESDTDPRTEVGQLGTALNRMLGHVGAALEARQESETRVRRFVADAGHELRTPLASIRGYAELTRRMQRDAHAGPVPQAHAGCRQGVHAGCGPPTHAGHRPSDADTRYALARIESEADRMTGLVEDLLLLARLDAGRPLEWADVDLSALAVDAVSDARAAGPEHRWRLELPPEPVVVRGDRARLQQVLVNLLANARTHTPEGTAVTARVFTGATGATGAKDGPGGSDGTQEVAVQVEDAGPGIAPELLPHVFERFARGDAARSRSSGSTGLGLAIVQAVVTAHGGAVAVDGEPGRTVFSVRLPSPGAPARPDSQPAHSLSTPS